MKIRCIAVDMPGWGESDTQTEETGYDHVASLIAFMNELGIGKAALVGNSMGGYAALLFGALEVSSPSGELLAASGTTLYRWSRDCRTNDGWERVGELGPSLGSVSRLAVSPDGRWVAFVAEPTGPR